jgi:hypothetical protein
LRPLSIRQKRGASDMNKTEGNHVSVGEATEPGGNADQYSSIRYQLPVADTDDRLTELETENSRLHRLVAELLIKNQQLRKTD